jgi:hypothetical protein
VERSSPAGEPAKRARGTRNRKREDAPRVEQGASAVEVPGIEPGSFVALLGLLRAQLAMPLLGPTNHASELV